MRTADTERSFLYLVRHGESEVSGAGGLGGDPSLSEAGRRQADLLAEVFEKRDVDAVYTSPSRRARETADRIARRLGLDPISLTELQEIDFGSIDGMTLEEIETAHPDIYRALLSAPQTVQFPSGESLADLRARTERALDQIFTERAGKTAVAVTHAGVIRAVAGSVLRMKDKDLWQLVPDHASFIRIDEEGRSRTIRLQGPLEVPPVSGA